MASLGLRSSRFIFFVIFFAAFVFLFGGFLSKAFGQEADRKTNYSASLARAEERDGHRPYLRDDLNWNWNQRGRTVPGGKSAAGLRFRAYQQKMAMRAQRAAASANATPPPKRSLGGAPATPPPASNSNSGLTVWAPLGPAPLASDATGDGAQDYNWVSGRATSVLIDPADKSGNTVLLGGAYGGLWKSTNAGSQNSNPASVTWQALIDDQPTLAVGAIALQPGNSNVILVGTGETNSSGDSYYGLGILRSADGGSTWTQIQSAASGQSFLGIGFSKIALSTANPSLVVAATAGDNGLYVGLEEDGNSTARGLYYSQDGGVTWNRAILSDGAVPASATSVVYNASQAGGTFYAFIRRHGLYSSTDGQHFTRLTTQPSAGLASGLFPAGSNASSCLIYRGEFAVVPGRNEMYVWIVDVQTDNNGNPVPADEGIWQTTNGGTSWTAIPDNGITECGDSAFGANSGCGVEQGWYNLELAAIPNGTATDVYAGAINLYKCTIAGGTTCTQGDWINLTHVCGCNPGPLGAPAHVHPDQHGIAFMVVGDTAPGYFAHDGGISRTLDGYSGLNTGSCTGTNQFDSLSETLGSMTEFVSFSVDPTSADILLGGTQDNGSPKTSTATSSSTWQNALGGDGGFTTINPTNPSEWFAANPYVTILKCESVTGTGTDCNDNTFLQVVDSNNLGGDQGAFYTPYILDPQNTSEMLVGTCRVWWISTSGTAPLQLSNDFDTLGTGVCTGDEINLVNALAAGGPKDINNNSTVVYAVTDGYGPLSGSPGGEVWVTTNAGVTLMSNVTQDVNPNGYAISTVAMDTSDATGNTAYVGIMGFSTQSYPTSHVWKTTNAGASWTDWSGTGPTVLPDAPVNALLVDSQVGQVYAGTDVGIFVSSTTAASWAEVGPTSGPGVSGFLPNAPVTALQLSNPAEGTKALVASTYGRGIWRVAAPDFAIAVTATPNATVLNRNVTWNGTLTALYGYSGSVALTCTAGAPGTCGITPPTVTATAGGAPFTVTLGNATTGAFNFTIQGTDGTLTHATATETLTVGTDVTWTATGSTTATVLAGQSTSYAFSAAPVGGGLFSSGVSFGCANLPALTSCGFSPASIAAGTGTTAVTLTIATTGPNAGAQSRPRARAGLRTAGTPRLPRPIPPKAGAVGAPVRSGLRQNEQDRGGRRPYTFTARPRTLPLFALEWVVMIGIVGLGRKRRGKPRLYGGIAVICLGLGLMAEISCGGVAGSGGSGNSPDFAIVMTQTTGSTAVNTNVPWNGMLTASNGYSGTVTLTCTAGAPATCEFAPPKVTPTAAGTPFTVTLGSAATGTFTFTISGTDGTLTNATPTETLTVTPPGGPGDFAIAVTATPNSVGVSPQTVTWNGTLTALNGYLGGVTLTCTAGAPGTCEIAPPTAVPAAAGAPYTVTLGSATAGKFNFTIQGTAGTLTHATPTETLTVGTGVGTPDFAIAVTATPNSTGVNQNVTWNGTLTALNGYIGNVTLTCTAGVPGVWWIAPTGPVTPTAAGAAFAVTLGSTTTGVFNFQIQGTDGTLTHATPIETLTVGRVVTISPVSATLFADEAGNSWPAGVTQRQFSATVANSTDQSVTWAVTGGSANGTVNGTGLYTAPAVVPNPATVTVTATSAAATAPGSAFVTVATPTGLGTSQITVTATAASGAAHGDVVTLIVQ
ncbi:MAG TPA: hypothetical protein VE957_02555 [Terriglobales bacterium]|nr:hypothetical protein [Terriglobales bacterium]